MIKGQHSRSLSRLVGKSLANLQETALQQWQSYANFTNGTQLSENIKFFGCFGRGLPIPSKNMLAGTE
jgi:hypothetical protein